MMIWLIGCVMPLRFDVEGTTAVMNGDLTSKAPQQVSKLLTGHSDLEWIEMANCPGSTDDVAALEAARMIRQAGINTRVQSDGEIASGAVDFFIAGVLREVEDGGQVGVHSWSGFNIEGSEVPKDDPEHDLYEEYYAEMDISEEFYWFTLEAAASDDIHWMTRGELEQYNLIKLE